MDNLLKIIERAGTDLLQADEYLARVGLSTMPEPPKQQLDSTGKMPFDRQACRSESVLWRNWSLERAGTDLQADEYLARVGVRAMPEPPKQ